MEDKPMPFTPRGPQGWRLYASCRGMAPELWEVPPGTTYADLPHSPAISICRDCPVRRECAADALDALDVGTIRGGVPLPTTGRARTRRAARDALAVVAFTGSVDKGLAVIGVFNE